MSASRCRASAAIPAPGSTAILLSMGDVPDADSPSSGDEPDADSGDEPDADSPSSCVELVDERVGTGDSTVSIITYDGGDGATRSR